MQKFLITAITIAISIFLLSAGCEKEEKKTQSSTETADTDGTVPNVDNIQMVKVSLLGNAAGVAKADQFIDIVYSDTKDLGATHVNLYYSNNRLGNRTLVSIVNDIRVSNNTFSYTWDTSALPEGIYSIHAILKDNDQQALFSTDSVSVVHGEVTHDGYYGDVQMIFQNNCQECHLEGGAGNPSFYSYETTKQTASLIKYNIRNNGRSKHVGYMPPFFAASIGEQYEGYRGLSESQIRKIEQWIDDGMPEGNSSKNVTYTARTYVEPAGTLLEFKIPEPFHPIEYQKVAGEDVYRCFLFDPGLTETSYLTGSVVIPDNGAIVHHVIVFGIGAEKKATVQKADEDAPGPGYPCFGTPIDTSGADSDFSSVSALSGWAPGEGIELKAEGTAAKIEAGSLIAIQLHYFLKNVPDGVDQSSFKLWITQEKPTILVEQLPIADLRMKIPPGETNHVEGFSVSAGLYFKIINDIGFVSSIPDEIIIYSLYPHAHLLGKQIMLSLTRANGEKQTLIDMPNWNFNWQGPYQLKEPVTVTAEDTLSLKCVYDNSADNPNQPNDPPVEVSWGDFTTDEMCLVFLGTSWKKTTTSDVPNTRVHQPNYSSEERKIVREMFEKTLSIRSNASQSRVKQYMRGHH